MSSHSASDGPGERLLAITGMCALVDLIPGSEASSAVPDEAAWSARGDVGTIQPFKNPVNAGVLTPRVMDIPEHGLWMHGLNGSILRAWAPATARRRVPAGAGVDVCLDPHGAVNGWWHTDSGVAVNQRRLVPGAEPATAPALACQGPCGLVWTAPAAARLLDHDERCLTCAGALALI